MHEHEILALTPANIRDKQIEYLKDQFRQQLNLLEIELRDDRFNEIIINLTGSTFCARLESLALQMTAIRDHQQREAIPPPPPSAPDDEPPF